MGGSKEIDRHIFALFAPGSLPKLCVAAILFLSLALLGGCVETTAAVPPQAGLDHRDVQREDADLAAVKLAGTSLTGAPDDVEERFKSVFEVEARKQQLNFVSDTADYFLRGYLTAYPSEEGTVVALVWDVFDTHKKRVRRLADQMFVPKSAEPGSWTSLSNEDWEKFAGLSAANLAAFISNTPEADPKGKPGLPKVLPNSEKNSEVASSKAANAPLINEGRTIAVENHGEAVMPGSKVASFH